MREQGKSAQTEVYNYSYIKKEDITDKKIKEWLKDQTIDSSEISDKWFKKYWDQTGGQKDKLTKGINKLVNGSTELSDGDFTDGEISVLDLLAKTKLVPSKGEARRLIDQGGISIDRG